MTDKERQLVIQEDYNKMYLALIQIARNPELTQESGNLSYEEVLDKLEEAQSLAWDAIKDVNQLV